MKKENFISLIISIVGVILFSLGMCMSMITEWNTFKEGIIVGIIGLIILISMFIIRRKMEGKPVLKLNIKTMKIVILGIVSSLILGIGMCMTMVWQGLMVQGIIVGIIGIIMLLCLIPLCKEVK
ncbi:hypothetical protein [Paraclostridium bifermentans]|jgi:phosphoglycerol transferase MdoB-like AlkP superfamily enzyme|uniref:hypothetical protein n=1 Tax=Paraclostridium bifermentans TaxID=1490 RepID=UPI0011DE5703|nr:hypothetical protein [Paraclostridium bifermentans]